MKKPEQHGYGASYGGVENWVREAKHHVLELADRELAFVHAEVEARLSDQGVRTTGHAKPLRFDPHILTEAVRDLLELGLLVDREHLTYGGHSQRVLATSRTHRRETAVSQAVRRKGMLHGRYLKFTDTAGVAGELVVRQSLKESDRRLAPIETDFGEVSHLFTARLAGALDSGAHVTTTDPKTGTPSVTTVPIEVKNRRLVLYPIHKEVHQLLHKAAVAQIANPVAPVMPVLVCRRAHTWLFWMARDLGFRVHAVNSQYVHAPKNLDERRFREVRNVLGLSDLTLVPYGTTTGVPLIRKFFNETVPVSCLTAPTRWAISAPIIEPYSAELRKDTIESFARQELLRDLRSDLEAGFIEAGYKEEFRSWSLPDLDE